MRPVPCPGDGVYALLTDGTTVLIRPAGPDDLEAVRQMHAQMSADNVYLRFFSISPLSAEREARRVCRPADADHVALLAWLGTQLVGVASYEPTGKPGTAEIAFAVSDHMHGRGVATLLLEHLVSIARLRGLHTFTAETLAQNVGMLKVFAAAGLPARRQMADGVVETTFPLPADETDQRLLDYMATVARREQRADVASLRPMLEPSSVAVVGASRHQDRVGAAIVRNIVEGGFSGRVYPVNPHARTIAGLPCVPSVAELPEPVDVAVIAVPPNAVSQTARDCGRRGVRSLVVITAGIETDLGSDLLATCRRYGMRLAGPNCFGIALPAVGLNATFTAAHPALGIAGLVVQSGGIGIAMLEHLTRLGIGVSSFASVGDKYDVSSNDMLMWWEQDGITKLAVLYVESFGNPRAFAQTARRVGQRMPVLTVIGGRSVAGQRAAASHTAGASTRLITQEALFGQAGVIAAKSLGELIDAAALLATQPRLTGNRVAIVSNAGGAGVLAADACGDNGLAVGTLSEDVQHRLRRILPDGAAVAGPVDTTAAVSERAFRDCIEQVAEDDDVDAVLVITVPTAICDLTPAITSARLTKPVAAVQLHQSEAVRLLRIPSGRPAVIDAAANGRAANDTAAKGADPRPIASGLPGQFVPAFAFPETAARALGHAARYSAWLTRPRGTTPELTGIEADRARLIAEQFLAGHHLGGWLPSAQAAALLSCFGIALRPDLSDTEGVEVVIRTAHEPIFGPMVTFSFAGITADVLDDQVARLTPLTDADAREMIEGVRAAPLLFGHGGSPHADAAALADLLIRVSRLADELPEVAELALSPVIVTPAGASPVGARIRLAPAEPGRPVPAATALSASS